MYVCMYAWMHACMHACMWYTHQSANSWRLHANQVDTLYQYISISIYKTSIYTFATPFFDYSPHEKRSEAYGKHGTNPVGTQSLTHGAFPTLHVSQEVLEDSINAIPFAIAAPFSWPTKKRPTKRQGCVGAIGFFEPKKTGVTLQESLVLLRWKPWGW